VVDDDDDDDDKHIIYNYVITVVMESIIMFSLYSLITKYILHCFN
jgi:hypothetical protein